MYHVYEVPSALEPHRVAHENEVVCLAKAHEEDEVDYTEADKVLSEHPVDHNHHRPHQLEPPAEEEEVEAVTEHAEL